MKYYIPLNRIEKLEALLKRAVKKGGNITYKMGETLYRPGTLYIMDPRTHISHTTPIQVRCTEVEVSGSYKINGWEFCGTIEHTPAGNIIRLANSDLEGQVPERYNSTAPICEHCGSQRARKDTYLIRNTETGEFKQVGRNCLHDFTGGLDADECAAIMSNLTRFAVLQDGALSFDEFKGNGRSSYCGVESRLVKAVATSLISHFGYAKREAAHPTVEDLSILLFETSRMESRLKDIEPDESLIPEIDEYVKGITDTYGYMYNAKIAWLNECVEYRDMGLIASLIAVYLRERDKIRKNKEQKSEFVGEVGSKVEFEVAEVRVVSHNSMYDTYYYAIKGTDGNTYMWSTGSKVEAGMKFQATVKSHSEWKGLKQTVVTRGKLL